VIDVDRRQPDAKSMTRHRVCSVQQEQKRDGIASAGECDGDSVARMERSWR
jgi:hypothetical protein